MPNFSDQKLKCRDCGAEFVWTAGEQDFYQKKGFDNPPSRCPACRQAKKQQRFGEKRMYQAVCAQCGKPAQVPFKPTEGRPVYCGDCFRQMKKK
ncbi:MAG: zinc-ribbon domain containing protein [candidate division WOR-3 bacterium]